MFSLSKIGDLRASEREQEKKVTTNSAPYRQYHTAIPYRASIGPVQGFPCVAFPHREKMFTLAGIPVMKTGFSLLEIIHKENLVLIKGMGLQFHSFFGRIEDTINWFKNLLLRNKLY